jgi:hypothetical protein
MRVGLRIKTGAKKRRARSARVRRAGFFAIKKDDPMIALANSAMGAIEHAAVARKRERRTTVLQPRLKLKLNRSHARKLLFALMSYISEERYAAGWLIGLEFILWEEALRRSGPALFPYERAGLRTLASLAGGWWMWSDSEVFVSMGRWLVIYRRHQATKDKIH